MTLPRDFLMNMARNYVLSPEEKDAFVIWFSSNKTGLEIATELHISNSALTTRMTHVYKKFSINGKGPGKYGRLLNFLTAEYRKCKASDSPTSNLSEDELNDWVQEVRQNCREMIQDQCGTMRSLTMSQPIDVSDLYTNVNVLEKITSHRRREIDELLQDCNPENFDRFGLGRVTEPRIPGLKAVENHPKLMVLGKPGSGKTTFLKHLAVQCNKGNFQSHRVPIFIELKQFAETEGKPSLLEYITQRFSDCDVSPEQIAVLLKHGKILLLLDGLDEVKIEDNSRVIKQVREFYNSNKSRTNQFVMTCRIAAKKCIFEKFTEVEIADFDNKQIFTFVHNWFQTNEPAKAKEFRQQLCENNRIRELATNPLLLTLLCLVFEELTKFPRFRSEIYEEAVDILLRKWDETRNIERERVYKNLSLQHKKDLLSQIALTTFERGDYFFKQKQLEQYISDYIRERPDAQNDPEALQLDSEAVLKSIEAQHGLLVERAQKIYSFSHLTFQEYFTARAIVNSGINAVEILANHITDKRWHEVFLLVAEMLQPADDILCLMKQKIDAIVTSDEKLQQFLAWVSQKSLEVQNHDNLMNKLFYFYIELISGDDYPFYVMLALQNISLEYDFNLYSILKNALTLTGVFSHTINFDIEWDEVDGIVDSINSCFDRVLTAQLNPELTQWLGQLKEQLPNRDDYPTGDDYLDTYYEEWWQSEGQYWTEELRSAMIIKRNIGYNWQLTEGQKELMKQYYNATSLLLSCMISYPDDITKQIKETLWHYSGEFKVGIDLLPSKILESSNHRGVLQYALKKVINFATDISPYDFIQLNLLELLSWDC